MKHIVNMNNTKPYLAFQGLSENTMIHTIADGSWSLIDALKFLILKTGPADLILSTWTAAQSDLSTARQFLLSRQIKSFRLLVDRSFLTRQPKYCSHARRLFGDECIRVWSSHAKFAIVGPVLLLTSANLNANRRLENYTLIWDRTIVGKYMELVEHAFEGQSPGEGFDISTSGRKLTEDLFREGIA